MIQDKIQSILNGTNLSNINQATSSVSNNPVLNKVQSLLNGNASTNIPNSTDWNGFTQKAIGIAQKENFPTSVLLGQASLETGRGTSNFARNRNNYFGMNANDANPDEAFSYNSPEESIQGYINMIKNAPRYSWAYQQYLQDKDPYKLISNIKASGYATDPYYVQKVTSQPEFLNNISS